MSQLARPQSRHNPCTAPSQQITTHAQCTSWEKIFLQNPRMGHKVRVPNRCCILQQWPDIIAIKESLDHTLSCTVLAVTTKIRFKGEYSLQGLVEENWSSNDSYTANTTRCWLSNQLATWSIFAWTISNMKFQDVIRKQGRRAPTMYLQWNTINFM